MLTAPETPSQVETPTEKVEAVAPVEAIKPKVGLMIHTDGAAEPNPGYAGWGIHGYLYHEVEPTKGTGNPDYVLTADDYMSKTEKATNVTIPLVTPVQYVDGCGSLIWTEEGRTNNEGELMAMTQALKLAVEQNVDKLRIWSDSKYVITGIQHAMKWRTQGWKKADGEPPKNLLMWQELFVHYDELLKRHIDLRITWTKGHNGNFGNEMADEAAYVGRRYSANSIAKTEVKLVDPNGYWKYDNGRHPFINHRRMYYNSLAEHLKPGEYYLGEHDKDDDLAGKRMANGAYALVRLNTPDPALELVRNYSCKMADGENNIMMARLDYLYRSDIHELLTTHGDIPLNLYKRNKLDTIVRDETEPLVRHYNPPLLIQRTVNAINEMGEVLDDFLTKPEEMVTTDLTSLIYESVVETNKKGEKRITKLLPDFKVGVTDFQAKVNYRHPNGDVRQADLKLILGLDLLDRNALRRLEEHNPAVTLVTWLEEPQAFRYAIIVKTDDAVGIWVAASSNLQIIPL